MRGVDLGFPVARSLRHTLGKVSGYRPLAAKKEVLFYDCALGNLGYSFVLSALNLFAYFASRSLVGYIIEMHCLLNPNASIWLDLAESNFFDALLSNRVSGRTRPASRRSRRR